MIRVLVKSVVLVVFLSCFTVWGDESVPSRSMLPVSPTVGDTASYQLYRALFAPLPKPKLSEIRNPVFQAKVKLGNKLYHDRNLSESRKIACSSCHNISTYGVDNLATSPGHEGVLGERNSPTTLNASLHIAQFWDGRAADVEAQAIGPILNPSEMAMPTEAIIAERLREVLDYKILFAKAFPGEKEPMSAKNLAIAIGAFERTLLTPTRFDAFLEGDNQALTAQELGGLKAFTDVGCNACHQGVGVGGGMYQKLGLVKPYKTLDEGRFKVTKLEADKYVFKVPSLRNVAKTGPYFHDGSVKSLPEAIKLMGEHQLGKEITPDQVASIQTFLEALTGDVEVFAVE
jgi:cytochrome c peroxidase